MGEAKLRFDSFPIEISENERSKYAKPKSKHSNTINIPIVKSEGSFCKMSRTEANM